MLRCEGEGEVQRRSKEGERRPRKTDDREIFLDRFLKSKELKDRKKRTPR